MLTENDLEPSATVVFLLELCATFLADISESNHALFQSVLSRPGGSTLWVSQQVLGELSPHQHLADGLGRTLGSENSTRKFVTLAMDSCEPDRNVAHAAELRDRNPEHFAFFVSLPDTSPINSKLPQPAIDYPHETTHTTMNIITSGTRLKYPACKVILSHAGGGLPYLISRVTTPLKKAPDMAVAYRLGTPHHRAMEAFCSFHYDLALSSSPQVLDMLLKLVPHDHILYGSDFPYAPTTAYPAFLEELESYEMDQELRDMINFKNTLRLFPRLASRGCVTL